MLLKRNLLTILYSVIFLLLFGIGFFELSYLAISTTNNRNVIACILILSIIIYLIAAFFIKESQRLAFLQKSNSLLNLLEIFLVVALSGVLFYLNLPKGADNSVLIVLLLASIYCCARLLGERFCGIIALFIGFFFILLVSNISFEAEQYSNTLCFLVPYAAFLLITRKLTYLFRNQGFMIFASYMILAILFSLAIILNPVVCALFIGCAFSLVFGTTEKKGSIMAKGPVSAGVLVLITAIILAGASLFLQDVYALPQMELDPSLLEAGSFQELVHFVLTKYTKAVSHLYMPFQYGIFPAALFFLGCTSGYYAIRKKASGIGPLCLAYIFVFLYYIGYEETGSDFYYMTYFLPVFSAYGFYNTLFSDEKEENKEARPKEKEITVPDGEKEPEVTVESIPLEKAAAEETAAKTVVDEIEEIPKNSSPETIPEWTVPKEFLSENPMPETDMNTEETDTEFSAENVDNPAYDEIEDELEAEVETDVKAERIAEPEAEVEIETMEKTDSTEELTVNEDALDDSIVEETMLGEQSDADMGLISVDNVDDSQLSHLLDRLDISDNIRRMNESAREDMADIIEREDEMNELLSAIPAEEIDYEPEFEPEPELDMNPEPEHDVELEYDKESEPVSHSSLPKYVKPDFDFTMEPISQPLTNSYTEISEYDKVPTINDLEKKWRELNDSAPEAEKVSSLYTDIEEETAAEEEILPKADIEEADSGFAYSLEDVPELEESTSVEAEVPPSELEYNVHSEEIVRRTGTGKRSYHKITIC